MSAESTPNPETVVEKSKEVARFSQDFFHIQAEFAQEAARIENISYQDSLIEYTGVFNFVINTDRNIENFEQVLWPEFINQSKDAVVRGDMKEVARLAHEKYNRPRSNEHFSQGNSFGCFSYGTRYEDIPERAPEINIHFLNNDGEKPLAGDKLDTRKKEVVEMFKDIREKFPGKDFIVTGASWLYNIPKYKELFPKEYQESLASPDAIAPSKQYLQNLGLWGQFLKADGAVNVELWDEFRSRIKAATSEDELFDSFKFKVLKPKAPISFFYEMIDKQN